MQKGGVWINNSRLSVFILRELSSDVVSEMPSFGVESCIRGHYHYRRNTRTPGIGVFLVCSREPTNVRDRFAVRLHWRYGKTVGYLPREISRACSTFLSRGGNISVEVTGRKRWGKGIEIPCRLELETADEVLANQTCEWLDDRSVCLPLSSETVEVSKGGRERTVETGVRLDEKVRSPVALALEEDGRRALARLGRNIAMVTVEPPRREARETHCSAWTQGYATVPASLRTADELAREYGKLMGYLAKG